MVAGKELVTEQLAFGSLIASVMLLIATAAAFGFVTVMFPLTAHALSVPLSCVTLTV